jgi:alpha-L-fucosidase 2
MKIPIAAVVLASSLFVARAAEIPTRLPEPEHGLFFKDPVRTWDEALPLGNGIMGALIWGDGRPISVSLDRSDLWDLRPVPEFSLPEYNFQQMRRWHEEGRTEELVRLYEKPYERPAPTKIPAGRIELELSSAGTFRDTALSLSDALASLRFSKGGAVRLLVHARDPIGLIQARSCGPLSARLVAPPFGGKVENQAQGGIGAGDLAQLGYDPPAETSGQGWRAYTQQGVDGFRFAVYLQWKKKGGVWEAAWSVASSFEGEDPMDLARRRVEKALSAGFEQMLESHRAWWRTYWASSSVRLPNPLVERQWYLDQYKFGSAARRGAPPITLQAIWTADNGQLPPWKGDYHHDLNTQLSYWPCYSGNHLEAGLGYLDWLWQTRAAGFDWTRRFFRLPGLNIPMTADLNGNQIGGWRQYTHSATTAAWLAHHFYLHWKFSADRDFLRERAYPYLREAAVFIEAFTSARSPDGLRTHPLSSSPEINDNRPEAWFAVTTNYDLALERWLMGAAAELAAELGLADETQRWRQVLSELPEFGLGTRGELLVAPGYPLKGSHRHFSHLMAIHPLGLIDWAGGSTAQHIITASLQELERLGTDWWTGYSFAWLANLAARARDGEKAAKALEIYATAFCLRNSFHCNGDQSGKGYSRFTYRPFTLEGNFAAAAAIQEMLLQSHSGSLVVFPAIPSTWLNVEFASLRAQGAFLVSARRRGGVTEQVEIVSEKGGLCRLTSPFTGEDLALRMRAGERRVLTRARPAY